MKKIMFVVNILVVVAVIVLYVLFFTGGNKKISSRTVNRETTAAAGDVSNAIYYINFDTVMAKYEMYLDMQDQLEREANAADASLKQKENQFQREVNDYQTQMQKGLMLRSQAQEEEKRLANQQQQLLQLQQNLQNELAEKQVVFQRRMLDNIMTYLAEIQPEYNYNIVLATTTIGGGVLYASKHLDITEEVINGLNERYKKEREKK